MLIHRTSAPFSLLSRFLPHSEPPFFSFLCSRVLSSLTLINFFPVSILLTLPIPLHYYTFPNYHLHLTPILLLNSALSSHWSLFKDLLMLNDQIYIPDYSDLQLHVLRHKHNHILSGHLGQNKTIGLIQHNFDWPGLWGYVQDYCKSCITCMHSKPQLHKPYGILQ